MVYPPIPDRPHQIGKIEIAAYWERRCSDRRHSQKRGASHLRLTKITKDLEKNHCNCRK